jgi:hypothetical protein
MPDTRRLNRHYAVRRAGLLTEFGRRLPAAIRYWLCPFGWGGELVYLASGYWGDLAAVVRSSRWIAVADPMGELTLWPFTHPATLIDESEVPLTCNNNWQTQ